MRKAFVSALVEIARTDESIVLLTGDMGWNVLEPFRDTYPKRYFNCGVAEQNMAGVAAGLALQGMRPVMYSITNFAVLRCYEQIRNDIVYHNLPVLVVGIGMGGNYGPQGFTHAGLEDITLMGLLGVETIVPVDPTEADWATRKLLKSSKPGYLRLGRGGRPYNA